MLSKRLFVRFIDGGETNEPNTDEEIYEFIEANMSTKINNKIPKQKTCKYNYD